MLLPCYYHTTTMLLPCTTMLQAAWAASHKAPKAQACIQVSHAGLPSKPYHTVGPSEALCAPRLPHRAATALGRVGCTNCVV